MNPLFPTSAAPASRSTAQKSTLDFAPAAISTSLSTQKTHPLKKIVDPHPTPSRGYRGASARVKKGRGACEGGSHPSGQKEMFFLQEEGGSLGH